MKVRITLQKSPIGRKPRHRATVKALGLRKLNQSVEQELSPMIQGMINSVSYLLKVEELKVKAPKAKETKAKTAEVKDAKAKETEVKKVKVKETKVKELKK